MTCPKTQAAAVLFDLDGTLVDTAPDFRAVLHAMCLQAGITPPGDAAIHATVSSGARALLRLAFAINDDHPDFATHLDDLLTRYAGTLAQTRSTLYPGMTKLLSELQVRNISWGVVTNKPLRFSAPLLSALGLSQDCAVLICPDHVTHSKPHPEPLLLACRQLQCKPADTFYVGDHPRDIEAGRAAGMTTIAAAWGYLPEQPPVQDWQADIIAAQAADLSRYLWQE